MALLMLAAGANFWMDGRAAVEPLRFRRLPMLAVAICFAAGELLALRWQQTFFLAAATLLLLTLALVSLRWVPRLAAASALALWIVVGCWAAQIQPPVPTQTDLLHYADGLSRTVRGRVTRVRQFDDASAASEEAKASQTAAPPETGWRTEPGAWEADASHATTSVDIAVDAVEDVTPDVSTMRTVSGGVRVAVESDAAAFAVACGDVLEMPLRLHTAEIYRDPGAWTHTDALLQQGIGAEANVKATRIVHAGRAAQGWRCRLDAVQAWAAGQLQGFMNSQANQALPTPLRIRSPDAAMLSAMLFGDRGALRPSMREDFERTGSAHLFVVSGMHVVLLAGIVFWLLRRSHLQEAVAVPATLIVATSYALLTGFGLPVQRALGMTAIFLLARWLARDSNPLNALGTAALVVLAFDPRALFTASFQMTFLILLAIQGIAIPLRDWLLFVPRRATFEHDLLRLDAHMPPRVAEVRVRLRMWGGLIASLLPTRRARKVPLWLLRGITRTAELLIFGVVLEICIALPMAIYFHRVAFAALPVHVISLPLVILLLCFAVPMFVLSLMSPWLALVPADLTALLLHAEIGAVAFFARTRFADVRVPAPAIVSTIACCGAMAFCCWALRARQRVLRWTAVCVLLLFPLTVLWPVRPLLHPDTLEVTALDVGQGDSLLVVSPQGRTLLIDAGGPVGRSASVDRWDVGEEVVAPYLWSRRIRRLDAVMLTHAHSDHMGGMPAILRDFRPRELWLGVQPDDAPGLMALRAEAQQLGIPIRWFRAGDAFAWGGMKADVLSPERGYTNPGTAINDDSLVLRFNFGKASALLEGDAETPSENTMLTHVRVAPATLLKVGHHGSNTSTTPAFLAAVAPQDAVISCGRHNTFGHPRFEVLERLEAAHVRTFRTDRGGAETFLLSVDGGISASMATSN